MTTPLKATVLVADDHAVVRHGVRGILAAQPDFEVVADGAEAVALALELRPDLAILDVSMPRLTGLQAAAELGRRAPGIRLLMLSMHDDEQYLFEALRAGASGYVLKSGVDRDLVRSPRALRYSAIPLIAAYAFSKLPPCSYFFSIASLMPALEKKI